jgi:hypothetical protein
MKKHRKVILVEKIWKELMKMSDPKFDDAEDEENFKLNDIQPEPFVDAPSDDDEVSEDA